MRNHVLKNQKISEKKEKKGGEKYKKVTTYQCQSTAQHTMKLDGALLSSRTIRLHTATLMANKLKKLNHYYERLNGNLKRKKNWNAIADMHFE